MMKLADFRQAGHWPTLVSAFVYFSVSCMVWVLIGALGNAIGAEYHLSDQQKGLVVAVPLLGGAILRLPLGLLTDRVGARRTALLGLAVTTIPLLLGRLWVDGFARLLVVGLLLGVAGASFAAALPLGSRWYPPRYQGLALGIVGAGNSGTALATFFGPRLAAAWGWRPVFALAVIPVSLVWALLWLVAKNAPFQTSGRRLRDYGALLRTRDAWWFCLFYSVTFGGFVGFASFLGILFHDQYGLSQIHSGNLSTLCVIAGSFVRPIGGYLADRFGGIRVLVLLYVAIASLMANMAASPPLWSGAAVMFCGMALLGLGNGAVFQLVPQRYPQELGAITGLVGAAGGIGGFILPNLLGGLKGMTGSFAGGFMIFALAGLTCATILGGLSQTWQREFAGQGELAAETP
jgi:NNP family nitrate/nitrite transporter-like MFS transporter